MSWVRPLLNIGLRLSEKPYLARETDPEALRARFRRRVRVLFPLPRGLSLVPDRLEAEGRAAEALRVDGVDADVTAPVLLYFHGGGYVFGAPETHGHMVARLACIGGFHAVLPRYRLAPEHPFPAALEDALTAYRGLLGQGIAADRIVLGGDSAGGGLALALLALLARLCGGAGPLPRALFAFSPLTDLTFSGPSYRINARADVMLPATRDRDLVAMYLDGADPAQPGASPLFADLTGAPPVLLMAGDTEILLDDTRRMAAALSAQGVQAEARIARDLPHVWPFFWRYLPEGAATLQALARWITGLQPRSGES